MEEEEKKERKKERKKKKKAEFTKGMDTALQALTEGNTEQLRLLKQQYPEMNDLINSTADKSLGLEEGATEEAYRQIDAGEQLQNTTLFKGITTARSDIEGARNRALDAINNTFGQALQGYTGYRDWETHVIS